MSYLVAKAFLLFLQVSNQSENRFSNLEVKLDYLFLVETISSFWKFESGIRLTNVVPLVSVDTALKISENFARNIKDFLIVSGGKEKHQWYEMS